MRETEARRGSGIHWNEEMKLRGGNYHIWPCVMYTVLPTFLREKYGCALYVGIMMTLRGCDKRYNAVVCDAYKNTCAHRTWECMIHGETR